MNPFLGSSGTSGVLVPGGLTSGGFKSGHGESGVPGISGVPVPGFDG